MIEHVLVGEDLQEHIARVEQVARDVEHLREQVSKRVYLRDMTAWTALRRAQEWVAHQVPPRCAWQGERVRQTVLQLGYGRPVMEGAHIGLMRPSMSANNLTYEVAVFPEGIIDHGVAYIAAELIHEATHLVTRELFCERMGLSPEKALVICDMNDDRRYETTFVGEALAFWNQVSWLFVGSHETLASGEQHWLFERALSMINRIDAAPAFAEGLDLYTANSLYGVERTKLSLPFVHLYGSRAGLPISIGDILAPSILNPLLHGHRY